MQTSRSAPGYFTPVGDDGTTGVQLTGSSVKADGAASPIIPGMLYNGANYDLERNNLEGTILASGTRTTTTTSAAQKNLNAAGIILFLNIITASGTGGLQPVVDMIDPVTGNTTRVTAIPNTVTTGGNYLYLIYPGASGGAAQQATSAVLPRTFQVRVIHGDATSYNYSIGYSLIR